MEEYDYNYDNYSKAAYEDIFEPCWMERRQSIENFLQLFVHPIICLVGFIGSALVIVTYALYRRTKSMWPSLTSCSLWPCLWWCGSTGGPWGTCLASWCVASTAWTSTVARCSWLASVEITTLLSYRPAGQALCFTATGSVQPSGYSLCSCHFPPSCFMSVTNLAQLNTAFGTLLTVKTSHMSAFSNFSHIW